jgi:hypothetical protein
MNATSPWVVSACDILANDDLPVIYERTVGNYNFKIFNAGGPAEHDNFS